MVQLGHNYAQMATSGPFIADRDIVPEHDLVFNVSDHRRVQRNVLPLVRYRSGNSARQELCQMLYFEIFWIFSIIEHRKTLSY